MYWIRTQHLNIFWTLRKNHRFAIQSILFEWRMNRSEKNYEFRRWESNSGLSLAAWVPSQLGHRNLMTTNAHSRYTLSPSSHPHFWSNQKMTNRQNCKSMKFSQSKINLYMAIYYNKRTLKFNTFCNFNALLCLRFFPKNVEIKEVLRLTNLNRNLAVRPQTNKVFDI